MLAKEKAQRQRCATKTPDLVHPTRVLDNKAQYKLMLSDPSAVNITDANFL